MDEPVAVEVLTEPPMARWEGIRHAGKAVKSILAGNDGVWGECWRREEEQGRKKEREGASGFWRSLRQGSGREADEMEMDS